jgi:hypothetical protein
MLCVRTQAYQLRAGRQRFHSCAAGLTEAATRAQCRAEAEKRCTAGGQWGCGAGIPRGGGLEAAELMYTSKAHIELWAGMVHKGWRGAGGMHCTRKHLAHASTSR